MLFKLYYYVFRVSIQNMDFLRFKIANFIKSLILIGLIFFIFVEISGRFLAYLKILPRGVSPVVSIFSHSDWSLWHPKNIKFTHHYNTCWEPSEVYFNNIGARGSEDVFIKKKKPRIALLGDSMIENINVTEGLDIASLLRKKLPKYEIINFSSRGMGMSDMSDIYLNLVKKYNVDFIFLFITENDFENHFYKNRLTHQKKFSYEKKTNSIIKYDRDKLFFKKYFTPINKLKRSNFVLNIKKNSYTFRVYYQIRMIIKAKKIEKAKKINKINKKSKDYLNKDLVKSKAKVYEHQVNEFLKIMQNDKVELIPFLNIRSYLYEKENGNKLSTNQENRLNNYNMVKASWSNHGIVDPFDSSIKYLTKNNLYNAPWLGRSCDDHYSETGTEFIASFTSAHFNSILNQQ